MTLTCRKCGQKDKYDINDISAKSKIIQIMAFLIFIIGTPLILFLLWDYIWALKNVYAVVIITSFITIPSVIYSIMTKNIERKQTTFNQNKI
jgi:hypothetical protein